MKHICRNVAVSCIGVVALMCTAFANADRPIWDYSSVTEVTIDRPAKDVWPYFFGAKEGLWSKQHYTHIAGESGKVGEIYMQTYPGGQIFYEAINVKPERQLVLKITHRKHDRDATKLHGYDFITLNEAAGHTTVVLQQAFAVPVDMPTKDLNLATEKQDKMLADIFQNLKTVVENNVGE